MMISESSESRWSELITSMKDELSFQLLIFLSIFSLAILWYFFRKPTLPLPPGPRGLPVVGSLPFLGPNLHHEFTKIAQRYGPIFKLHLGRKTYIIVSSSDLAKEVVRTHDDVFANRDPPVAGIVITYGGKDIVWSDNNPYWRNLRKVFVSEVLSNKNLEASSSFRRVGVRKVIKHVYESSGTEVDVGGIAFTSSWSVVTSMMWGKSLDLEEDEKSSSLGVEFREVILKIVDLLGAANLSDFEVIRMRNIPGFRCGSGSIDAEADRFAVCFTGRRIITKRKTLTNHSLSFFAFALILVPLWNQKNVCIKNCFDALLYCF